MLAVRRMEIAGTGCQAEHDSQPEHEAAMNETAAKEAGAPGLWEFPTAELARGESAETACTRAVLEQAGLNAVEPRAFYTLEYNSDGERLLSLECFFCTVEDADAVVSTGTPVDANAAVGADAVASADDAPSSQSASKNATASAILERRWVPRSELPDLAWAPASAELARVIAGSDAEGDRQLIKRRADSRKSMQGNKRADTKPELLVRQRLRAAGLSGYRLQWKKAPGRPDIAYPGRKVAIFVNGCYWHRCPYCQPPVPKRNTAFWQAKFERNKARDSQALAELEEQGWTAITIWECQLKKDAIDATMERVVEQVRAAKP